MQAPNIGPPPPVRKEVKIREIVLFWPVTENVGNIGIYRLDARGFRLIRVLHGCKVEG